jgi:CheY-like chemotaxis protein
MSINLLYQHRLLLVLKLNHKPILIADDNHINQTVVTHILKKWGIKISTANNGYEALAMVAKENYDIY